MDLEILTCTPKGFSLSIWDITGGQDKAVGRFLDGRNEPDKPGKIGRKMYSICHFVLEYFEMTKLTFWVIFKKFWIVNFYLHFPQVMDCGTFLLHSFILIFLYINFFWAGKNWP